MHKYCIAALRTQQPGAGLAYVIGIDGGTESLRAHVFDLSGRSRGVGKCAYVTTFPEPGRAEQTPEDWWHACGVAVHDALEAAGIGPDQIIALAADTTSCTVVALDAEGRSLRPALLWMDVRAHREADEVAGCGDPALRVNGGGAGPVSPEWMIPKALWIARHQPEIFAAARDGGRVSGLPEAAPDGPLVRLAEQRDDALALSDRPRRLAGLRCWSGSGCRRYGRNGRPRSSRRGR